MRGRCGLPQLPDGHLLIVQGNSAPVCRAGLIENVLRITESNLERYTCPESLFNSTDPSARPGLVQGLYNELATLMDVPGDLTGDVSAQSRAAARPQRELCAVT